jgi:uncharacterized damage-inducible protein DinB
MTELEPWLRGPLEGIDPAVMPIAHSLKQVLEDLPDVVRGLTTEQIWAKPGNAASVGFHLKHMAGSLDRLYTYARGEKLTEAQFAFLRSENNQDDRAVDSLLAEALSRVKEALHQLQNTRANELHETRLVGRKELPSNTLALLYHGAEHVQRHLGAMIATAKVVRTPRE